MGCFVVSDDYTPSWAGSPTVDDETPPEDRFGGGVDFDGPEPVTKSPSRDRSTSEDAEDDAPDPETPVWVDDTVAIRRGDLLAEDGFTPPCLNCLDEQARAVYQLPYFPHASAYFQLLDRHGLRCFEVDRGDGLWIADSGLRVEAEGSADISAERHPSVSYLTARGSPEDVAAFVEDLTTVVKRIKRELRAPSLREHADAAGNFAAVDDEQRLVDRATVAEVVDNVSAEGGAR